MSASAEAIRRLLFTYADCVDRADYAGIGALFEHGRLDADRMDPIVGAEAIRDFYAGANRRYPDPEGGSGGTARPRHFTTNLVLDVDPKAGTARAHSYYVVFQQTPKLPLQPIIAGRYRDRFRRIDGKWRFAERYIRVDLVGDLSQHLTFELG